MKKKQMLAMLLAALMTLNVPLVAFAEGEPTDPNTANLIQPCAVDNKAPELKEISINSNSINAGNPVIITIKATDNLSGINDCGVQFYSEDSDKKLLGSSCEIKDNTCTITIDISEYAPSRRYKLEFLSLTDKAGNTVYYAEDPINDDRPLPQDIYFDVIPNAQSDAEAPELKEISINSNSINAGNPVIITIKATDNLSGINDCGVQFYSEDSDKKLLGSSCEIKDNTCTITIDISEYAPNRRYNLEFLSLTDKAGNTVYYAEDPINDDRPLPQAVYFTVINDDSVLNPQPNPEQKPFQPSYSTGSSASGSSVTSVKSAPAASGSSIKQEEKDRQFWKNKQDQIRKAANGKKIRIFIPKETTRVPASFMESIRTAENDITVELRWNGKKITITPETALKRSVRRVFWNLKTLLEYYHA